MTKIEQVLEALEAAKHAMTNQRYLLPRLGMEDAHAKVTSAIAILKDMDGQEPVAWMERWIPPPGETHHPKSMTKWNLVEPKYAGQTLEGRIEELRSYVFDGRAQHEVIAVHAHPSPSAPVELSGFDIDRMLHQRRLRQEQSPTCVSVTQDVIGYRDAIIDITKHYTLHRKP